MKAFVVSALLTFTVIAFVQTCQQHAQAWFVTNQPHALPTAAPTPAMQQRYALEGIAV